MKSYLKIALKVLLRRKFFTFVSLFGVTITIVVLLVATSLLDHFFVPQGVESRLDRTLTVRTVRLVSERGTMQSPAGYRFLRDHVKKLQTPELVSALENPRKVASYAAASKIELYRKRTDGEFWRILDFDFLEGTPFTADDERNANFVAVINDSTRRRFFGAAPATGKMIDVDGQRFRVIGVVADVSFLHTAAFSDVWVPISTSRSSAWRDELLGGFTALILARSRDDIPRIKAEFDAMVPTVEIPPDWDSLETRAESRFEAIARDTALRSVAVLRVVMVLIALLVMALPAVNLVNLNLSRILERASEIGVRKAFGASTSTLVGQFVVENLVLTLAGGMIGLAVAGLVLNGINGIDVIPYAQLRLNWRIFAYAMMLVVSFGLLSGVYPAWRMSRLDPVQALKGGSR